MDTYMGMTGWGCICSGCGAVAPTSSRTATGAVRIAKSRYRWRQRGDELLCCKCQPKRKDKTR